ncbi:methyl-accepting chemotaxis protein [Kordiimonas aquimaris]|uniref:methyl-accepting chemotaxis protein n=1 Tax=Kordiimonas aquimaris TaxID=707591 RepID=UPI0021CE17AF|nr:methyl-accepting chemotaxis protein [Kordiimonas aquimaris]
MFNLSKKNDASLRVTELENALAIEQEKNAHYTRAFAAINSVALAIKAGDLEARIVDWDQYADQSSTLSNVNHMLDLTDAFIREATASLDAASEGEFYRKFLVEGMAGTFGRGAEVINRATGRMEQMVAEQVEQRTKVSGKFEQSVMEVIATLTTAVEQVKTTAMSLMTDASENQSLAATVAAAAEQATSNVQTVASAAEELSASVEEISRQVNTSAAKSTEASGKANDASTTIEALKNASDTIGRVVSLINDIAEQTNLLALNATIEAARAGDAGRGFAVVASEVKSLAQQTANATGEIGSQVSSIQNNTGTTVEVVSGIGTTIAELNEIAAAIAAATEEQSAATSEISRNIQQASEGTQQVAGNIKSVHVTADKTMNSAKELDGAATELARTVMMLKEQSESFLEEIRDI